LEAIWNAWWGLLLNILVAINSVVNNPGVSIIVFTLLVKLLTVPLTMKSLRSTRNMQQIQPLIKEIQKKYSSDRAKQQEETMKIYQQYGVNPAAGCFPILVQLPIFFALYSALTYTLQHGTNVVMMESVLWNDAWVPYANFSVPFLWIPNLAAPDPTYILPVLSGIFQFIQSRMSLPIRDPSQPMDSQTRMMQTMMQFMPIYIILISLNFPAGTVLYWAMSNVFSAVQQYFITGFGSLPTLPGLHWLPRKEISVVAPPPPPVSDGKPVKRSMMMRMMDKAVEAQGAQKAAQVAQGQQAETPEAKQLSSGSTKATRNGKSPSANGAGKEKPRAEELEGAGEEGEPNVKVVPTSTMKYASDLKYRKPNSGNGAHHEEVSSTVPTALPKKKRGKR
jgi:YidC/Oxa1 family membrane protein insertase